MASSPSIVFLKAMCGFLIGMNAFALLVLAFAFALGFGTSEQRWEWVGHSGLSMLVQLPLLVMVRQAERRERARSQP
jgi:hypothetical protein